MRIKNCRTWFYLNAVNVPYKRVCKRNPVACKCKLSSQCIATISCSDISDIFLKCHHQFYIVQWFSINKFQFSFLVTYAFVSIRIRSLSAVKFITGNYREWEPLETSLLSDRLNDESRITLATNTYHVDQSRNNQTKARLLAPCILLRSLSLRAPFNCTVQTEREKERDSLKRCSR